MRRRAGRPGPHPPAKRGPKTVHSDKAIVHEIRATLAACPFHGEGYRKVRARLAHRGLAVGGKRVLRLMRIHGLLAPRRLGPPNGNPAHDGTIVMNRPDAMWGTDATKFYTEAEGWCWFFGAVDHGIAEVVGWHAAKGSGMHLGTSGGTSPRPDAALRLGTAVHGAGLDPLGEVAGDHPLSCVRRRT